MNQTTTILGVGGALPDRRLSSRELERSWDLPDGWIMRRTGIESRAWADADQATSDLAVEAGAAALSQAGLNADQIGLLLLATSTPDHPLPPTAPLVAHRLNLTGAGAIDLTGACAGFLYGLALADGWCRMQGVSALLIAANVLSRRINPGDPQTAALFADGAGAVVLGPGENQSGILSTHLASKGQHYDAISIAAGGSRTPLNKSLVEENLHLMRINDGGKLFRHAVDAMVAAGQAALQKADLNIEQIDHWIPHQANARIMAEAARQLDIPPEKTISTIAATGNTSSASIPLAWAQAVAESRIQPGQTLLLTAAGAGMISAAAVVRS